MNFTEIDFASFTELLKSMKTEIEAELNQNPELDDESRILLDSINILIKELKGIETYDELNMEKKKTVLPHLALVFIFTKSLYEDEGEEFYDEEMMDWDGGEEEEEEEEEEEGEEGEEKENKQAKPLQVKSNQCCGGDHHHSHKTPKEKK
jgi:hypothetical protein